MKKVFITGTAGFIGYHLAKMLLEKGFMVHGYDGFLPYYDVNLKKRRNSILNQNKYFSHTIANLEDKISLESSIQEFRPHFIIHLAAQAGVRYSIENPNSYIDSNILGTFNVLEAARTQEVSHLLMASTSSVYGASTKMPFSEQDCADTPLTLYAATKKANESMAHAYANVWKLPITMFRFFTVYGPWGRPDLALFKFVSAMLKGQPIDIYNNGDMYRDFTYVDDLVTAITLLMDCVPDPITGPVMDGDSLSPVAPFRVVNIGNSQKVNLLDFISAIEDALDIKALRNYLPMQLGDVKATFADTRLLNALTGFAPSTEYRVGVNAFVNWYREYYNV